MYVTERNEQENRARSFQLVNAGFPAVRGDSRGDGGSAQHGGRKENGTFCSLTGSV